MLNRSAIHKLTLFFLFLFVAAATDALAAGVGSVTRQQSDVSVTRMGQTIPLAFDATIYENDDITTGTDARIEITFIDGTKLTIGENSRLVIDKFLFDPDNSVGTAILNAAKGPFRFITGKIGEMANKRVVVQNTFGTIGIRGTDFWGGPALGVYGVLLLDGTIVVRTDAGARILNVSGTGVNLTGSNVPPGEVAPWGQDRVNAALASISFR